MNKPSILQSRSLRPVFHSAPRRWIAAGLVFMSSTHVWAFQSASVNSGSGARQAGGGGTLPGGAPEINSALIWGAAILLIGGVLILSSRRRRTASASKG